MRVNTEIAVFQSTGECEVNMKRIELVSIHPLRPPVLELLDLEFIFHVLPDAATRPRCSAGQRSRYGAGDEK